MAVMTTSQQLFKVAVGQHRMTWVEDHPTVKLYFYDNDSGRRDEIVVRVKELAAVTEMLDKMLEIIHDDGDDT